MPTDNDTRILLGHGGGGRLSRQLIDREIVSRFGDGPLEGLPDGALLNLTSSKIVFSTDSFVVNPLEFPGGNIGELAIHGTVNDLAVAGGRPRWLSMGLILEEGLELSILRRVLDSLKEAAEDCGVVIATGDTKVVSKGQCDGLYINTAGIAEALPGFDLRTGRFEPGDAIIVSGTLGDHGMAVMAAREGIETGQDLKSDTGPVHRLVQSLEDMSAQVKFMRDPTRGGLASVVNEMVEDLAVGALIEEAQVPYSDGARGVAEVMGIDLMHVACEGRMLAVVEESIAAEVVRRWRALPEGLGASQIGVVTEDAGRVLLETGIGGQRVVDVPQGGAVAEDLLMHELSLAESLIDQLVELVERERAERITEIKLEIGEMSGVERYAFEFAFPMAAEGTAIEGAKLCIDEVPVMVTCGACGRESNPEYPMVMCTKCGSLAVEVTDGKEFKIKSVEVI